MTSNLVDLLTSNKTCPAISQRAFLSPSPHSPLPLLHTHTSEISTYTSWMSLSVQVLMTFPNGNSSGINSLKYSSFLLFYLHLYFPHFNLLRWKYFLSSEIPCLCCLIEWYLQLPSLGVPVSSLHVLSAKSRQRIC